jgi:hypothetical protein
MLSGRIHRWRSAVAQAAIVLLLVQTAFGVSACRNFLTPDDGRSSFAKFGDVICAVRNDTEPSKGDPSKDTHHQCPVCVSLICHVSAILTSEAAIPVAPSSRITVLDRALPVPASIYATGFHNRGPPVSLIS